MPDDRTYNVEDERRAHFAQASQSAVGSHVRKHRERLLLGEGTIRNATLTH